jgi:NAD(P)-dependent dehydrogenase (short-subunit alcohol dehydrogenase family)
MNLEGKTVFISGASRGIGLAIAIRAARDGANVALIAKTAEPHPKLEGTVYMAARADQGGGRPRAADRRRYPRRGTGRAGRRADGRTFRRDRRLHQQRLGDQPVRHRGAGYQAL